ncbi:hypothetical protein [Pseudotabrizicola alkalilacus]|uniref:Uncharacterized protein n=1 Tax=Pseudotabrizicola alkalilacus TaxID=2305252 RepID=A0A411Z7R0_9RHOB|nr:hypothetical protein [Pseudotabrizicola alkalilacus]RGP39047.1 hypothetical protein D1012_02745 [Pseudotabrizicola alkalilacus]
MPRAPTGLAARTTTLETAVNDPATGLAATLAKASTVEEAITTPTTGLAARTTTLETAVRNPATGLAATLAAIEAEAVTRSDAVGALAGQIETVSTSVGDLSADVSTQATAIATIDGRRAATLAWRARAGGAVGEIELVAADNPGGDAASETIVRSDRLKFLGNFAQFFSDVTINGDLIVTGSVTTPRLAGNAVSVFRGVSGGGASPPTGSVPGSGPLVTVFALTFEPADPNGMLMILMGGA